MKKHVTKMVAFITICIAMANTAAFAAEDTEQKIEQALAKVEKANERIEDKIEKAVDAQNPNTDIVIENLLKQTDKIAQQATDKAEKDGIIVECELQEVEIDGQIVLVDPLRVVSVRR